MSFSFQWPRFSDQFHADAIQMLNNALNKGDKPPVIADKIEVVELEMGTQPPELEIRDIGDLTTDQFRGIFRLTYSGDAHIVLKTKVQANPLNHKQPDIHLMSGSRGMLAAKEPLVVPMLLRLSHFRLNSYVVLVVSKQKGITLVFKTDPLQNVDINSTFDSIAVIQNFIQREIEGQLRQMFREDLPGIIHRLSQQWVKAKVEAPYLDKRLPPVARRPFDVRRVRSVSGISTASSRKTSHTTQSTPIIPPSTEFSESLPDADEFDPTYGLRPEGLPTKSLFANFGRLFKENKGLADLTEEQSDADEDGEDDVQDEVDEDDRASFSAYSSAASLTPDDSVTEYESIPAVGGGTVTRPRVYHSQSMIRGLSVETPPTSPPLSVHSLESTHLSSRRLSVSSSTAPLDPFHSGSPPPHHTLSEDPKIVLRPTVNSTLHQLSTLSSSNHTLSPYTRSLSHFAVRSGPPRTLNAFGVRAPSEHRPVKAKRKRTYRIGGKAEPPQMDSKQDTHTAPLLTPSEIDLSEIDQYFRVEDESDGLGLEEEDSRVPPGALPLPRHPQETLRRRR